MCLSPSPQAEAPALDVLPEKRLGAPAAQLCEETSGCRAELLSVKAHVAELEGKVSPSTCWMGNMGDQGEEKGPCLLQTASG